MLDFSAEIDRLRPILGDRATEALIARERREVFSVYPEVRLAAWAGALLIAAAVGLFVKNNFELFDRVFLAAVLGAVALACYVWAWRGSRDVINEYILLLGALLVSADVGFIEQQFDVFGAEGQRHFLLLALVHGATAYRFNSRLILSLSIASLAAWMGIERNASSGAELAVPAFACAAVVLAWRALDRRYRPNTEFSRVFEHSAANLALWGGLLFLAGEPRKAALITIAVAALVMAWGFRTRVEAFVLYAFVYAVIAAVGYAVTLIDDELAVLAGMLIAIPTLVYIHRRFKRGDRA